MAAFASFALMEVLSRNYFQLTRAALGETLDPVLGSDDGGVLGVALPLEGIVFGAVVRWWRQVLEWCTSTARPKVRLDGMAQRGLCGGRVTMNSHRAVELSSIVCPEDEDGLEEDDSGNFCSVCIGAAEGLLDLLCPLIATGRLGVSFGFFL